MSGLLGGVSTGLRLASGVGTSVRNLTGPLSGAAFGGPQGVQLGPVTLLSFEVPASVNFGGAQLVEVHKLSGGQRQVDCMGPDDDAIAWNATILGPNAADRARAIDAIRQAGLTVPLSWADFDFNVVVTKFRANYQRAALIPYEIECVVLSDYGSTATPGSGGLGGILGGLGGVLGDVAMQVGGVVMQVQTGVSAVASVVTPITSALGISVPLLGHAAADLSSAAALAGSGPPTAFGAAAVGFGLSAATGEAQSGVASTGGFLATLSTGLTGDLNSLAAFAGLHAGFAFAGQSAAGAQAMLAPVTAHPFAPISIGS